MAHEITFAMIKPDAVSAKNVGKIVDAIEQHGFAIVGLHKIDMTKNQAHHLYEEHKARPFFGEMVDFITSGPVVIMALKKENAVKAWRDLMGATNPAQAMRAHCVSNLAKASAIMPCMDLTNQKQQHVNWAYSLPMNLHL